MSAEYKDRIREIARIGRSFGLSFHKIFFKEASMDDLSQIASFGLPNRFIHWYFGGQYKMLRTQQENRMISILELVLNTDPVHAFLLDSNSELENLMVIAHVHGHVDFFKNNVWYARSDKEILNKTERNARFVRELSSIHGKHLVEDIIAAIMMLAPTVSPFERDEKRKARLPVYFFAEELPKLWRSVKARRTRVDEQVRGRLEVGALLIPLILEEMEYFDLVGGTQIINEGWASFVESMILKELLGASEWLEFSFQFSKRPAPYLIGSTLFRSIFNSSGWEKALEVRRYYEDVAFVDEFLTQELSERLDLFVYHKDTKERDYDVAKVKEKIITEKQLKGSTPLLVKEYDREGLTVVLENPTKDKYLDRRRTERFLATLRNLWPFTIRLQDNERLYTADDNGVRVGKVEETASSSS